MKTLIIYKSNTGFTKQYVDMIKRRIYDADVVPVNKFRKKMIKDYDFIFFGGPLRNKQIQGVNKLLSCYEKFGDKDIFIFATGIEPIVEGSREDIIERNGLNLYHVRFYLLPGGMDISKMSKFNQFMIKAGLKNQFKKQGYSKEDTESMMNTALMMPRNFVNEGSIQRMMEVYQILRIKKS